MDNNLVQSMLKVIDCHFVDYLETEIRKISLEELEKLDNMMDSVFLFSLIWSLCCTVDQDSRIKINSFLRKRLAEI